MFLVLVILSLNKLDTFTFVICAKRTVFYLMVSFAVETLECWRKSIGDGDAERGCLYGRRLRMVSTEVLFWLICCSIVSRRFSQPPNRVSVL